MGLVRGVEAMVTKPNGHDEESENQAESLARILQDKLRALLTGSARIHFVIGKPNLVWHRCATAYGITEIHKDDRLLYVKFRDHSVCEVRYALIWHKADERILTRI